MLGRLLAPADKKTTLLFFDTVFGLDIDKEEALISPQEVDDLVGLRLQMKRQGDYDKADEIRNKIFSLGYQINNSGKTSGIIKR